jgi:putative transposase
MTWGMGMGGAARLVELSEQDRDLAWSRWLVIAPTVEDGVPLTRAAAHAGVSVSTARRWVARYRQDGLSGLARARRSDRGRGACVGSSSAWSRRWRCDGRG